MLPLTSADFPLVAIGNLIYRKTLSSPFLTCHDDNLAADVCSRLNRDETSRWGVTPSNGYTTLVYGKM